MTYYFPLGRPATVPTNVDYSIVATTASIAETTGITALTASFAGSTITPPPAGTNGTNQDPVLCGPGPSGSRGPQGTTGLKGTALVTCPPGTKQCTSLTGPPPFPLVCIEIPEGCTSAGTPCPDTLEGFATTTTTTTTSTTTTTTVPPGTCYEVVAPTSTTVLWQSVDGTNRSSPISSGDGTKYICSLIMPYEESVADLTVTECTSASTCTNNCTNLDCDPCADAGTCI